MKKLLITKKSVSAIVPVYNEERTVAKVVRTLIENQQIAEAICINDGSTDKSLKILKTFKGKATIINIKRNRGKGNALAQGIKKAKGEIVVFIDADMLNLSGAHIKTILDPILKGKAKAVLGYPHSSTLTGERAYFKKDLIPHLKRISAARFGVEIFLNSLFPEKDVKKVQLKGIKELLKHEKHGTKTAVSEYLMEGIEIAKEIGRVQILSPNDKAVINKISKAMSIDELRSLIGKLYNKSLKQVMEKYVLKYLEKLSNY